MNPRDLMEVARALAESGHAPTAQAKLRRAVSTAYSPAWHQTYPALEHGEASGCRQAQTMREFPMKIRDFAEAFVALQKARQEADHALDTPDYRKSDVLGHIASAELAVSRFEQADVTARCAFAAHVMFRQRPS